MLASKQRRNNENKESKRGEKMRLAYFTFTDKNEVAKMNAIEIGNFPDCNMMLQAANSSVPDSEWGSKQFV